MKNGTLGELLEEKEKISAKELDLIILIQDYRKLIVSKNKFLNTDLDWHKETLEFYKSIDKELLRDIGLSHNHNSFEYVLNFKVTDELLNTELI